MSERQPLTLASLADVFARTLATSELLAALAAETQPGAKYRVFFGYDLTSDPSQGPLPSAIVLPQSDEQQSDVDRTLRVLIEMRLRDPRKKPEESGFLIVHSAPGVALRWHQAIESELRKRVAATDAKTLTLDVQYDFTSLASMALVVISIVATVALPKRLRGEWFI